jgi:hypothetical protein
MNKCGIKSSIQGSFLNEEFSKISSIFSESSTAANTNISNNINLEAFYSQNFINFDDILKVFLIGDKAVGKSLFISKFLNLSEDENKYAPTERYVILIKISLEIKKTFSKILEKNIKIEFWDSNYTILTSNIVKSIRKN